MAGAPPPVWPSPLVTGSQHPLPLLLAALGAGRPHTGFASGRRGTLDRPTGPSSDQPLRQSGWPLACGTPADAPPAAGRRRSCSPRRWPPLSPARLTRRRWTSRPPLWPSAETSPIGASSTSGSPRNPSGWLGLYLTPLARPSCAGALTILSPSPSTVEFLRAAGQQIGEPVFATPVVLRGSIFSYLLNMFEKVEITGGFVWSPARQDCINTQLSHTYSTSLPGSFWSRSSFNCDSICSVGFRIIHIVPHEGCVGGTERRAILAEVSNYVPKSRI